MSAPVPVLIPEPFANDAGPSFINTIPATTADPQRAAYDEGFPPLTFQSEASGGKPPLGQDFNGILNAITQHLFALQGGQLQTYRADVATAIGGYKLGAVVAMTGDAGYWVNLSPNNTTDPDAGGAGWAGAYVYGSSPLAVTGGVLTLTALEAAHEYLVFSGSLSGNQQVEVPAQFRHWLVINNCTMNGFTLTVKTAAGTGVSIPAGGSASPTAIYCDTVNVNRVFVPSALPTAVAADPDTIPLRDNLGVVYGTRAPDGDASTALASTSFVNPGVSLSTNGFHKFPDGTLVQWGQAAGAGANRTVAFPVLFATGTVPYAINLTPRINSGDALGQVPTIVGTPTAGAFVFAPSDGSVGTHWVAWGRWLPL